MTQEMHDFYHELGADAYLEEVRRFVPRYDKLVQRVVSEIVLHNPKRVLDVGAGIGNIDGLILAELPSAHMSAVESAPTYAAMCRRRLAGFNATVIEKKIQEISAVDVPPESYDAALCNLVLHNVHSHDNAGKDKSAALKKIYYALRQGGIFVWGDLVDYGGLLQEFLVGVRHLRALLKRADYRFVLDDLKKERTQDSKLSIDTTLKLCKESGFKNERVIAMSYIGTWAAFAMEK